MGKNKATPGSYIFEANDFDKLEEAARQAAIKAARDAEEAARRVTFSQEQLDTAKQEAYDRGFLEGVRETTGNQEQRIANSLDKLIEAFDDLASHQDAFEALQKKEAAVLAVNIARRFVPSILDKYAQDEILKLLRQVLNDHIDENVIKIRLNPQVHDDIQECLTPLVEELGFAGKIDMVADLNIKTPDCVVEWQNGGAQRIHHELWQEIEHQVADFLNQKKIENLEEQTIKEQISNEHDTDEGASHD